MALVACGGGEAGTGDAGSSAGNGSAGKVQVTVATMLTEDLLPLWVAEQEQLFGEHGIDVKIEIFQSAQELSTAVTSGAVDFAMTDPMVAASLTAGGTPVTLEWVTLGATPEQGRFGIMTSPDSGISTLQDLAGKPIGVGSNTILEYVMDRLMEQAGIPASEVKTEEIKKIPVRYEMMTQGQVAAAALPSSLLALGEATGMVLVADDTTGANISQSVMVVRDDFAASADGQAAIASLREVWDQAAQLINANPDSYRPLLASTISLPEAVVDSYPVSEYPLASRPTAAMIDPVLQWMDGKGYLTAPLTYNPSTGQFDKS
jgi:NitT/TauT family transport system substrate-binding protein